MRFFAFKTRYSIGCPRPKWGQTQCAVTLRRVFAWPSRLSPHTKTDARPRCRRRPAKHLPPSAPESPANDIKISHRINDIVSSTPQNRLTTLYPRIVSQPITQSIPPSLDFGRQPNRINNSRVRFVTLTLAATPPTHPPPHEIENPIESTTPRFVSAHLRRTPALKPRQDPRSPQACRTSS